MSDQTNNDDSMTGSFSGRGRRNTRAPRPSTLTVVSDDSDGGAPLVSPGTSEDKKKPSAPGPSTVKSAGNEACTADTSTHVEPVVPPPVVTSGAPLKTDKDKTVAGRNQTSPILSAALGNQLNPGSEEYIPSTFKPPTNMRSEVCNSLRHPTQMICEN
jgi:hypothetical protein